MDIDQDLTEKSNEKHPTLVKVDCNFYINIFIPAVKLTCTHVFRRFLSHLPTDFHEILQGLFSSHSATAVKFSSENIVGPYSYKVRPSGM